VGPQPAPGCFNVIEGPDPTLTQIAHDRTQAAETATPVVQVRGHGQEALARQPVDLSTKAVAHPGEVVDYHHTRPRGEAPPERRNRRASFLARSGSPGSPDDSSALSTCLAAPDQHALAVSSNRRTHRLEGRRASAAV
jgi:hypothetical protein